MRFLLTPLWTPPSRQVEFRPSLNAPVILPEVVSQKHVEELTGKDKIFKNVLEKVSD